MMPSPKTEQDKLGQFFDILYGDIKGTVYTVFAAPQSTEKLKSTSKREWNQNFYEWPTQREQIISDCFRQAASYDVYIAPALFKSADAHKENVLGANVYWVEFDGTVPTDLAGVPEPTVRVKSSVDGHEHWYWRSREFIGECVLLERANRSLAYAFGADSSGWDANQVLRAPGTFNHKRLSKVEVLSVSETIVNHSTFDELSHPPRLEPAPVPDNIPPVEDVIAKYKFTDEVFNLFKEGDSDRSNGLMRLGYYLAEMQLPNEAILSVLLNADTRWGKFADRSDRLVRLMEIVTVARTKWPVKSERQLVDLVVYGFRSLINTDVHVEWMIDGWLEKSGYMLLTGPSGVGKTQLALQAAAHISLGRELVGLPVRAGRIGVLSLEMGLVQLKLFLEKQAHDYSDAELDHLDKNVLLLPLGEPLYLNDEKEAERVGNLADQYKLDGLIIDSMGSAASGELATEKTAKELMDWNDRFRKQTGIFTWFIHHHRKAQSDNSKPDSIDDIFGSQYLTRRATTVACLWPTKSPNQLELSCLKLRLDERPSPFHIVRGKNLNFTKYSGHTNVPTTLLNQKGKLEI